MGILLAFAVGYVVGARSGERGYRELLDSMQAVRSSEEFQSFLAALRSHLGHTLGDLAARLGDAEQPLTVDDAINRVRQLINSATAPSSAPFRE